MSTKKDGGPAFPVETYGDGTGMQTGPVSGWETGMSLRDYFAAQAMPALVAKMNISGDGISPVIARMVMTDAYIVADAMLEARKP